MREEQGYDAAVVGASLAGCTAAIMLGRSGLRVALVDKRSDARAFKRICGHFIQSSAVATLRRLDLLEPIVEAGGVRSRIRLWTRWGIIEPPDEHVVPAAVNIRREILDPIVREAAANTPGVDLLMGRTVTGLLRNGEGFAGVEAQDVNRDVVRIPARLVVGADGRDSKVAKFAAVRAKVTPHERFSYAAYFEGPSPEGAPDGKVWFLDPHWGAAFPTDGGLTMYACMPTKDRLPEFRRDLDGALRAFIASLPEAPPILDSQQVGAVLGKIEMPNVQRAVVAPGLALVGDAALATDPLFGVGCGWAFQTSEWLADAVTPALRGEEQLSAGLGRYRARHRRGLNGHAYLIHDYATGRPFSPVERVLYPGAAYDPRVARIFHAFGTRNIGPARMMATAMPLALAANVRHALSARGGPRRSQAAGAAAGKGVSAGEGVAEAVQ